MILNAKIPVYCYEEGVYYSISVDVTHGGYHLPALGLCKSKPAEWQQFGGTGWQYSRLVFDLGKQNTRKLMSKKQSPTSSGASPTCYQQPVEKGEAHRIKHHSPLIATQSTRIDCLCNLKTEHMHGCGHNSTGVWNILIFFANYDFITRCFSMNNSVAHFTFATKGLPRAVLPSFRHRFWLSPEWRGTDPIHPYVPL